MLTLYHAPKSRSSSVVELLEELGVLDKVDVRRVTIPRQDGSGARDPANPTPKEKCPIWSTVRITYANAARSCFI
ncbi:hypothetical protein ACFSS8_13620 [Paracoccus kondratievae]